MRGRGKGQNATSLRNGDDFQNKMQRAFRSDVVAVRIYEALQDTDAEVYVVGGAVRDVTVGRDPKDIDLLVRNIEMDPVIERLKTLGGNLDLVGKSFGILLFGQKEGEVEIAFPRVDKNTGDATKEFEVTYDPNMTVEEDLIRRDYTVNAMAWSPKTGEVIDPHGGQDDMINNRLRLVREEALSEDPLRIIRGAVLHARYGLEPNDHITEMFGKYAPKVETVPTMRRGQELYKLLKAPDPEKGFDILEKNNVLQVFWGGVEPVLRRDRLNRVSEPLRLAALLRDNDAAGFEHVKLNFNGPESLYPRVNHAQKVSQALNDTWPDLEDGAKVRHFLHKHSVNTTQEALQIAIQQDDSQAAVDFKWAIKDQAHHPLTLKELELSGKDLIQLGHKPGPEMGDTLKNLMHNVLDDPKLNNRDDLVQLANQYRDNLDTLAK